MHVWYKLNTGKLCISLDVLEISDEELLKLFLNTYGSTMLNVHVGHTWKQLNFKINIPVHIVPDIDRT